MGPSDMGFREGVLHLAKHLDIRGWTDRFVDLAARWQMTELVRALHLLLRWQIDRSALRLQGQAMDWVLSRAVLPLKNQFQEIAASRC